MTVTEDLCAEQLELLLAPEPRVCPECGRIPKRVIAGKCGACYEARRHGRGFRKWPELDPEITAALFPVPGTSRTFARRVFSHIDVSGDCWVWTSATGEGGYGLIGRGARGAGDMAAHRAVWQLLVGPIADGLELDHLCRNHPCVNPDHLDPVTPAINQRRGFGPSGLYARRETCDFGHPFDGIRNRNGYIYRYCKTCHRERERLRTGRVPRDPGACKKGHAWTPESTYISPGNGRRTCKICMADRQRARTAARRRTDQIGQLDEAA